MFGIGFQEVLIIALLALIVFGPQRLLNMLGDLSRLADEARRSVNEFQSELVASENNEPRREAGEAEPTEQAVTDEQATDEKALDDPPPSDDTPPPDDTPPLGKAPPPIEEVVSDNLLASPPLPPTEAPSLPSTLPPSNPGVEEEENVQSSND